MRGKRQPLLRMVSVKFPGDLLLPGAEEARNLSEGAKVFSVDNAFFGERPEEHWLSRYGMTDVPQRGIWRVSVRNDTLLLFSEYTPAFFSGRPQKKRGKVSVGCLPISSVCALALRNPELGNPLLCFCCVRSDGTLSNIAVETKRDVLPELINVVAQTVCEYWETHSTDEMPDCCFRGLREYDWEKRDDDFSLFALSRDWVNTIPCSRKIK